MSTNKLPKGSNKYLEKVQGELSVYQQYLLHGIELTPDQWATWDKIDQARAWLKEGFTDSQVLAMIKNARQLQERRARELLTLAYAVFAELRQSRDKDGVKDLYAEQFRAAAYEAKAAGDYYNYGILLDKAAKIDGAYDNQKAADSDTYKKKQKVLFKVKNLTINNGTQSPANQVENATYEIGQ